MWLLNRRCEKSIILLSENPFLEINSQVWDGEQRNYTCVDFVKWRVNCTRERYLIVQSTRRKLLEANNLLPAARNNILRPRMYQWREEASHPLVIPLAAAAPTHNFLRDASGELIVCVKTHYSTLFGQKEWLLMFRLRDMCSQHHNIKKRQIIVLREDNRDFFGNDNNNNSIVHIKSLWK